MVAFLPREIIELERSIPQNPVERGEKATRYEFVTSVSFSRLPIYGKRVTEVTFTVLEGGASIQIVVWQFWGRAAEAS